MCENILIPTDTFEREGTLMLCMEEVKEPYAFTIGAFFLSGSRLFAPVEVPFKGVLFRVLLLNINIKIT